MNRFEDLTVEEIAEIINNRTDCQLLVIKTLAQTEQFPLGNVPMGMPYLTESIMASILAHSSMSGNDLNTRWMTFILFVSYVGGHVFYNNINDTDCEISVVFRKPEEK